MSIYIGFGSSVLGYGSVVLGYEAGRPGSIRLRFGDPSFDPTTLSGWQTDISWRRVSYSPNVWDCLCPRPSWEGLFTDSDGYGGMFTDRQYNPVEVLSADTTGVTDMGSLFCDNTAIVSVASFYTGAVTDMGKMFCNCTGLTSIPTFDTHSVVDFSSMLSGCSGLVEVPLLDTSSGTDFTDFLHGCTGIAEIPDFDVSSATDCFRMCHGCVSVELGAYRLYGKLSSLDPVPMHSYCFKDCGINTESGRSDLALIPPTWK